MSLDVYLIGAGVRPISTGIWVREEGRTREITRDEWDRAFPGWEPVVATSDEESDELFTANITHNLNTMAGAAGIYEHLWRPEEIGITTARQLIEPLRAGLDQLVCYPERFKQHNPENGWGTYDGLVRFVREYLAACVTNPDATVRVSR